MEKHIDTTWKIWNLDVWGNAKDGWKVNDRSCSNLECFIWCKIQTHNRGTKQEFISASPSVKQIRAALGLTGMKEGILTGGDDLHITVENSRNGYPLGELFCTSHESLSPIRMKE